MSEIGSQRVQAHPILGDAPSRPRARALVDGRALVGIEGEPIAMLLLAHGIIASRTMPASAGSRGYFCGVGRCSDCAMTVDGELNVMTCVTPLRDGMVIATQKGHGSWEDSP